MLSQHRIALVDCNNFYVSCERLFRPDLLNKPVAVLSNNDGCIVSRSAEVKALGIKMAVPVHQIKALINQHDVQLFSSNYALYADLSSRVMSLLSEFSPHQEIYSIDESFLDLT
ncbi:MAG TPA: DNA polymerase V subunit UmuC, partial [Methylococcaceae bacterium]|nr:DNA polymerase V subunit UmuC [Methylococcaceae bacterium]